LNEHPEYLVDKLRNGWLICGSEKVYKPPGDTVGTVWESSSGPALDALKEIMLQETFWQKMTAHLSQEHTRNYPLLSAFPTDSGFLIYDRFMLT
jgi:proteasome activator subunit 4